MSDVPEAVNEYDSYADTVLGLLCRGASDDEIAEHLHGLEREWMGLAGQSRERLLEVAHMLRDAVE